MGDFHPEDIHSYRVDRHTFTVYLGGDPVHAGITNDYEEPGVEHSMADRFEINLGLLSGIDPKRPILVNMSSCGGFEDEGMKIFSAILFCQNPVTVFATKAARSMTSIIPLAADRFVIRPPATYMIHRGTFEAAGLDQEVETWDIERRRALETMFRIYTARLKSQGAYSRWREEKIREMLDERIRREVDVYYTAEEAQRAGFVDRVFDGNWETLRATKVNDERRKLMTAVLRRKVKVEIKVS